MPEPPEFTAEYNIPHAECVTLHGKPVAYDDELDVPPEDVENYDISGTCVFKTIRHRLIGEIFHLLYSDRIRRVSDAPKYITIIVPQDSDTTVNQSFSPLQEGALTKWGATGFWRDEVEDDLIYSILFYDSPTGMVSTKLLEKVETLGEEHSPGLTDDGDEREGEYTMFATIEDVDATTLTKSETVGSFPSQATLEELENIFPRDDPRKQ